VIESVSGAVRSVTCVLVRVRRLVGRRPRRVRVRTGERVVKPRPARALFPFQPKHAREYSSHVPDSGPVSAR
jgi:hypothetical protein